MQNKIFIKRKFNCSSSVLFNWLTQPDLLVQWFGPDEVVIGKIELDKKIGGKYSIELIKPNQQFFFIEGEYVEMKIPSTLVFSFRYSGLPTNPPESLVKINIEQESEEESILYLTQEFGTMPSDISNRKKSWIHMFQVLSNLIR